MPSCSLHHWVLFFITLTFTTAPVSAAVCSTTVKLHQSVTLPCEHRCSGLAKWTLFKNRDVIFAQCDQTSCRSLKEGYEMSRDQYLKGDLSLTIRNPDYSMRDMYACECGVSEHMTVNLRIDTEFSALQLKFGEDLILDVSVPESVEVIYQSSGSADKHICNVTQHTLRCNAEYTPRTSLRHPELTLSGVQRSDSGRYTIRDTENDEDIHVYTVSVTDDRIPWWVILLIVLLVVFLLLGLIGLMIYRKNAVHREFLQVSKQLEHVNKLIQQARRGKDQGSKGGISATEAVKKAEEALTELEQQYRENPKYSEQITLFCLAKRAELEQCSGDEGEGLLLTERAGMMRKMEELMTSLQQLSGDGAGDLKGTSSNNTALMEQAKNHLDELEQWCKNKRAELNNRIQQHRGGEPEGTSGVNEMGVQSEDGRLEE